MGFGVKIVESGVSVDTAADYQVVLSSDWPILKIAKIVPVNNPTPGALIYNHNLGYHPAFLPYADGLPPNANGQTAVTNLYFSNFYVDQNNLYYDPFASTINKGFVIIFEYDVVNTVFQAVTSQIPGLQNSTPSSEGLVVAAANSNIDTINPSNLQLTTNDRPMQVNSSGAATQSGTIPFTVNHGLGYTPVFLLYQLFGSNLYMGEAIVTATLNSLSFRGVQAPFPLGSTFYLILKDAFASGSGV